MRNRNVTLRLYGDTPMCFSGINIQSILSERFQISLLNMRFEICNNPEESLPGRIALRRTECGFLSVCDILQWIEKRGGRHCGGGALRQRTVRKTGDESQTGAQKKGEYARAKMHHYSAFSGQKIVKQPGSSMMAALERFTLEMLCGDLSSNSRRQMA